MVLLEKLIFVQLVKDSTVFIEHKIYYHAYNKSPAVSILNQMNPIPELILDITLLGSIF
jgi:hypothetical protein